MMKNNRIPDPAFWAITEQNGAQLIAPESELSEQIFGQLDVVPTHGVVALGDILVASEFSSVISPEDLGIDRKTILGYQAEQEEIAKGGLRRFFRR